MLTSEEMQYIRDWARSGNEHRSQYGEMGWCGRVKPGLLEFSPGAFAILNSAGLTIAALADALEQAKGLAMMPSCCGWDDSDCRLMTEIEELLG
jgi:hypothetical protein